ncbi:Stk1 family PASTA domain-containing Ser/Thr kinase [Microbacterium indicum]|uniref:Stk1 family PASTA domain-containing Ser/Thr kinase n=1 Tax=Microbacterium indicum TaxID=358100 RepID=UPI0004091AC3|nr:Stk1 family PASTA domain-containing Ser/Thr kinase [Microbacterium indicum]
MADEPTQAVQSPVQQRILSGRYRVDSLIGRGGMASVYRGYDLTLGRTVAIKILRKDLSGDNTFRTRFRLEAQAASRMSHPSIVRVYDAGEDLEDDGFGGTTHTPFIVMELVRGTLLKDVLNDGAVGADDAARYVDGILEALEYSHRAGVVHRDIKPGNVMITDAGQVKVMDFGIARAVSDTSSTVAETTTILGTAAYFSPEQAKGDPVDARADLYSTGIVLYELLTGQVPFRGDSPVAVAYQHVREAPVAPSQTNPDSPAQLDPIVLRALAKDPNQRFSNAASFREALDRALDGKRLSERQLAALSDELYGERTQQQAQTEHTLAQLATENGSARTQAGPPVAWVWAGVILVVALIAAVVIWVVRMDPLDLRAADTVDVSNVVGGSWDRAQSDLEGDGLTANRVDEPSDTVPEGVVISTDPASGTSVAIGSTVDVTVSEGPQLVEVPALAGMSEDDARSAITDLGLQVGRITPENDAEADAGTVLTASAEGDGLDEGDEISAGSTVDLTVASGRVTVVDLSGSTVDFATSQLEGLHLTVKTDDDPTCVVEDPPTVHTQSHVGDVAVGSTVTLYTCSATTEDDAQDAAPDESGDEN